MAIDGMCHTTCVGAVSSSLAHPSAQQRRSAPWPRRRRGINRELWCVKTTMCPSPSPSPLVFSSTFGTGSGTELPTAFQKAVWDEADTFMASLATAADTFDRCVSNAGCPWALERQSAAAASRPSVPRRTALLKPCVAEAVQVLEPAVVSTRAVGSTLGTRKRPSRAASRRGGKPVSAMAVDLLGASSDDARGSGGACCPELLSGLSVASLRPVKMATTTSLPSLPVGAWRPLNASTLQRSTSRPTFSSSAVTRLPREETELLKREAMLPWLAPPVQSIRDGLACKSRTGLDLPFGNRRNVDLCVV